MSNFSNEEIDLIASEIEAKKVAVLPTDTVYGLSSLASDRQTVERIYQIKKRNIDKPLIVLMKSFCMIRSFCILNKKQYSYIKENLEKGEILTVILKNKSRELAHLTNKNGGVAIRIPKQSNFLMKLIKRINKPIVSTSLNLSGEPEILDLEKAKKLFKENKIDLIVDGGNMRGNRPSKVVDIIDIDNINLIRD